MSRTLNSHKRQQLKSPHPQLVSIKSLGRSDLLQSPHPDDLSRILSGYAASLQATKSALKTSPSRKCTQLKPLPNNYESRALYKSHRTKPRTFTQEFALDGESRYDLHAGVDCTSSNANSRYHENDKTQAKLIDDHEVSSNCTNAHVKRLQQLRQYSKERCYVLENAASEVEECVPAWVTNLTLKGTTPARYRRLVGGIARDALNMFKYEGACQTLRSRRSDAASRCLQAAIQSWFVRLKKRRKEENDASAKLQMWWKQMVARLLLRKLRREEEDNRVTLKLQMWWRQAVARVLLRKLQQEEEERREILLCAMKRHMRCRVLQQWFRKLLVERNEAKSKAQAIIYRALWQWHAVREAQRELTVQPNAIVSAAPRLAYSLTLVCSEEHAYSTTPDSLLSRDIKIQAACKDESGNNLMNSHESTASSGANIHEDADEEEMHRASVESYTEEQTRLEAAAQIVMAPIKNYLRRQCLNRQRRAAIRIQSIVRQHQAVQVTRARRIYRLSLLRQEMSAFYTTHHLALQSKRNGASSSAQDLSFHSIGKQPSWRWHWQSRTWQ